MNVVWMKNMMRRPWWFSVFFYIFESIFRILLLECYHWFMCHRSVMMSEKMNIT